MKRFEWLTTGSASQLPPWDVDLTPKSQFATVPSRGAIVPNWVLVLPRHPTINIATLPKAERVQLLEQAKVGGTRGPHHTGRKIAFFEHGATGSGTLTGCGVDHAHLHVVELDFDLISVVAKEVPLRPASSSDPWGRLGRGDYLLVGDGEKFMTCEPAPPTSQFIRRLIAREIGHADKWDHNYDHWEANIRKTIVDFEG